MTEKDMMPEPECPKTGPYALELEPGTYWWCSCGRSQTQPFCDGTHRGTVFEPVKLEQVQAEKVWFCGCKHSTKAPHCDGAHKQLIGKV